MDPTTTFCPNLACPARGQSGQGNIGIHSRKEQTLPVYAVSQNIQRYQGHRLLSPAHLGGDLSPWCSRCWRTAVHHKPLWRRLASTSGPWRGGWDEADSKGRRCRTIWSSNRATSGTCKPMKYA